MLKHIGLLAAALTTLAAPALAQPSGLAVIPAAYQGGWTDRPAECRQSPNITQNIITITARGWSAWEEGGRVTAIGQTRGTTRYFRTRNYAGGNDEVDGSIALQRIGPRLAVSFNQFRDGRPTHYVMTRCP